MPKFQLDSEPVQPASESVTTLKPHHPIGIYAMMAMQCVMMAVLGYVVLSRDVPPGPQPDPVPVVVITEDVERITVEAEQRFIKNKAEAAERLAADIKAGKIQNSNQFGKMAMEYQEAIERDAFGGMTELNQKYVRESGKEGWTAEQLKLIQELQARKAKGYRRLLK